MNSRFYFSKSLFCKISSCCSTVLAIGGKAGGGGGEGGKVRRSLAPQRLLAVPAACGGSGFRVWGQG